MTTLFIDTDAIQSTLKDAAIELQARYLQEEGEVYRLEDLQKALTHWLELSIETLAEEALFHVAAGDRATAFNREGFELQMRRIQSLQAPRFGDSQPVHAAAA